MVGVVTVGFLSGGAWHPITRRDSLGRLALTSLAVVLLLSTPATYAYANWDWREVLASYEGFTHCVEGMCIGYGGVIALYGGWVAVLCVPHIPILLRRWNPQMERGASAASFGFVLPFVLLVVVPFAESDMRSVLARTAFALSVWGRQDPFGPFKALGPIMRACTYCAVTTGAVLLALGLWRSVPRVRRLAISPATPDEERR